MTSQPDDHAFLQMALDEAAISLEAGDWPIGAVLVDEDGALIGGGRNTFRTDDSRLHHAELRLLLAHMPVVRQREGRLTIYSTLEPCVMCLSAVIMARVRRIVWACSDPYGGGGRLLRLDAWPRARYSKLVPEPFDDLKQVSKDYLLTFLERNGEIEKLALFRAI